MRWSDSKTWEAENLEEAIGKLQITTVGKMKVILIFLVEIEIIVEPNAVNESVEEQEPTVLIIFTMHPHTQHALRFARSIATGDNYVK